MKTLTLTAISVVIIVVSSIKLMCYYLYFDINIFDFIEADEIIIKGTIYIPFVLIFLGLIILAYKYRSSRSKFKIIKMADSFENEYLSALMIFTVLNILLTVDLAFDKRIQHNDLFFKIFLYFTSILLTFFIISYLYIFTQSKNKTQEPILFLFEKNTAISFLLLQILVLFALLFSITEITRAQNNMLYKDAKIVLTNKTIICSIDTTLIGISKNYIFLFDNKNNKPIIYNKSNLISLSGKYSLNSQ